MVNCFIRETHSSSKANLKPRFTIFQNMHERFLCFLAIRHEKVLPKMKNLHNCIFLIENRSWRSVRDFRTKKMMFKIIKSEKIVHKIRIIPLKKYVDEETFSSEL
jgi:hypothetical protein